MENGRPTVLVVEDETNIRELVRLHLKLEKMTPTEAADGTTGLELAQARRFDLVILDLMLPGIDGVTLCRAIRRDSPNADVADPDADGAPRRVRQGARSRQRRRRLPDQAVRRARADGARARAAPPRRRSRRRPATAIIRARSSTSTSKSIRRGARVRVGPRDVDLTFNEFELLRVLLSNPGIVFSREALLSKVWKDDTFVTVRSVDTLVKRIRKKIEEDPAGPAVILTVWGAGYKAADV